MRGAACHWRTPLSLHISKIIVFRLLAASVTLDPSPHSEGVAGWGGASMQVFCLHASTAVPAQFRAFTRSSVPRRCNVGARKTAGAAPDQQQGRPFADFLEVSWTRAVRTCAPLLPLCMDPATSSWASQVPVPLRDACAAEPARTAGARGPGPRASRRRGRTRCERCCLVKGLGLPVGWCNGMWSW